MAEVAPPNPPPAKCVQLIRAAFRVMEKDGKGGVHPKSVKHFGQFVGLDWVLDGDYCMDGDEVGARMTGQEVMKFLGRRLSGAGGGEWQKELVAGGKGYLAAMRGSSWRRNILDEVLRVLSCGVGEVV